MTACPMCKAPAGRRPLPRKLSSLRDKQMGDTIVLPDQPEGTYYVAVLIDKVNPSMTEFYRVYQDSSSKAPKKDPLLTQFERERQDKYRQDFMDRLRQDAKLDIHRATGKRLLDETSGDE